MTNSNLILVNINTDVLYRLNPCISRFKNWLLHYNDFQGDILDFLELDKITPQDKLWVAIKILPVNILETFVVDCIFAAWQYDEYAAAAAAGYTANVVYYTAITAARAAYWASRHVSIEAANAAELQERENQINALIILINAYRNGEK